VREPGTKGAQKTRPDPTEKNTGQALFSCDIPHQKKYEGLLRGGPGTLTAEALRGKQERYRSAAFKAGSAWFTKFSSGRFGGTDRSKNKNTTRRRNTKGRCVLEAVQQKDRWPNGRLRFRKYNPLLQREEAPQIYLLAEYPRRREGILARFLLYLGTQWDFKGGGTNVPKQCYHMPVDLQEGWGRKQGGHVVITAMPARGPTFFMGRAPPSH